MSIFVKTTLRTGSYSAPVAKSIVCDIYSFCIANIFIILYFFVFEGVNLLIGTENGLYLLDRSGNGKGMYAS